MNLEKQSNDMRNWDLPLSRAKVNFNHPKTDLDFSDDIALLSNKVNQARELLQMVESECKKSSTSEY